MAIDDQDDDQEFLPLPDPTMRTWVHPSEMAAAAKQAAFIEKRRKLKTGLTLAAGVLIGAGGMMIGVASIRASSDSIAMIGSSSTIASLTAAAALSTSSVVPTTSVTPPSTQDSNSLSQQVATTSVSVALPIGIVAVSGVGSSDLVLATGIVLDGHVLASASALSGRQQFTIWNGSESVSGHLIAADPFTDLAVLAYDESTTLPELSYSRLLRSPSPGSEVQVLGLDSEGNPVGEEGSIISLGHRTLSTSGQEILGSIRTTALLGNIKPGALLNNSNGRPLGLVVNSTDHLISAIPIDEVLTISKSLIENGWATDTWLGVTCTQTEHGLSVESVSLDSPAALGGLGQGDIVVSLNGIQVASVVDLVDELRTYDPTNSIELILERDSKMVSIQVQLGERVEMLLGDH